MNYKEIKSTYTIYFRSKKIWFNIDQIKKTSKKNLVALMSSIMILGSRESFEAYLEKISKLKHIKEKWIKKAIFQP